MASGINIFSFFRYPKWLFWISRKEFLISEKKLFWISVIVNIFSDICNYYSGYPEISIAVILLIRNSIAD